MSDKRMAGDKLGGRNNLRDRLGDDEYGRIGQEGHDEADSKGRYSAAEVKSELRSGQYGDTVDERVDHFRDLQSDGVKFNSRAQQFLSSKYGFDFAKNNKGDGNKSDGTNDGGWCGTGDGKPGGGGNDPGNGGGFTPGGNQNGGNASNSNETNQSIGDTTINGDGNIVNNSNSNSNFQQAFGGDTHNFTYNGGSGGDGSNPGGLYDTPTSMATMAGFYAPKDSAKDTGEFLAKYMGGNNFHQAAMRSDYNDRTDTDYKSQAASVNQFNPLAMQERIDREPLINRSRSTVDFAKLFGDVDNWQQQWVPTTAPGEIESNVGEIADKYKEELD